MVIITISRHAIFKCYLEEVFRFVLYGLRQSVGCQLVGDLRKNFLVVRACLAGEDSQRWGTQHSDQELRWAA